MLKSSEGALEGHLKIVPPLGKYHEERERTDSSNLILYFPQLLRYCSLSARMVESFLCLFFKSRWHLPTVSKTRKHDDTWVWHTFFEIISPKRWKITLLTLYYSSLHRAAEDGRWFPSVERKVNHEKSVNFKALCRHIRQTDCTTCASASVTDSGCDVQFPKGYIFLTDKFV